MLGRTLRRMRRRWRRTVAIVATAAALSSGGVAVASTTAIGPDTSGITTLVGLLANLLSSPSGGAALTPSTGDPESPVIV